MCAYWQQRARWTWFSFAVFMFGIPCMTQRTSGLCAYRSLCVSLEVHTIINALRELQTNCSKKRQWVSFISIRRRQETLKLIASIKYTLIACIHGLRSLEFQTDRMPIFLIRCCVRFHQKMLHLRICSKFHAWRICLNSVHGCIFRRCCDYESCWQTKFVHQAGEIPVLDVHLFHLVIVAQ